MFRRWHFALAFGAALSLAWACGARRTSTPTPQGAPRLLVMTALGGEIEPCGCTLDLHLGGLARLTALVEAERAKGPTAVLVVGAHLFDPDTSGALSGQAQAKARLIVKVFERIGIDAIAPTAREIELNLTGWPPADRAVDTARIIKLGELKVGVLQVQTATSGSTIKAQADTLRAKGAQVVVALANIARRPLRRLARKVKGVDLWVLGQRPAEASAPSPAGGGYLLEAGDRGRHVARVMLLDADRPGRLANPAGDAARAKKRLTLQLKMRRDLFARTGAPTLKAQIEALEAKLTTAARPKETGKRFTYELVPINEALPRDPAVAEMMAAYEATLKTINMAEASTPVPLLDGQRAYAKAAQCVDCHEAAQAVWDQTAHARAWQTLVDANKTFDVECVSCHVTAWMQPGGSALGQTEGFEDIACEACHGPSQRHVDYGGDDVSTRRAVPESVCVTCHNKKHSPDFNYQTYLPKILGPGHAPLAN